MKDGKRSLEEADSSHKVIALIPQTSMLLGGVDGAMIQGGRKDDLGRQGVTSGETVLSPVTP